MLALHAVLFSGATVGLGQDIAFEASGELDWRTEEHDSEEGAKWMTLRFPTLPGMLYSLETTEDLEHWTEETVVYGLGHELQLSLFEMAPSPDETAPGPVPSIPVVSLRAEPSTEGGTVLMWRSRVDWSHAITWAVSGEMTEDWERSPLVTCQRDGLQLLIRSDRSPLDPPVTLPALGPEDQAVVDAFTSSLAQLNLEVAENGGSTGPVPSPPPSGLASGRQRFCRLVRREIDSDQDGLPDWYEFGTSGTEASLADTDGDGASDYREHLAFTDPRATESGGQELADPDTRRRFENSRYVLVRLDQGNVGPRVDFKGLSAGGQVVWSDDLGASWLWSQGERSLLDAPARRLTWSGHLLSDPVSYDGSSTVRTLDPQTGNWVGSAQPLAMLPESQVEARLRASLPEGDELLSWSIVEQSRRGLGITEQGVVYGEVATLVDAMIRSVYLDGTTAEYNVWMFVNEDIVCWRSASSTPSVTAAQGQIYAEGIKQGGGNQWDFSHYEVTDDLGAILRVREPITMSGYQASGPEGHGPWFEALPEGLVLPSYCPHAPMGVAYRSEVPETGEKPTVFWVGRSGARVESIPVDAQGSARGISRHGVVAGSEWDQSNPSNGEGVRLWRKLEDEHGDLDWAKMDFGYVVDGMQPGEAFDPSRFFSGEEEDQGAPARLLGHIISDEGSEPVMAVRAEMVPDWNRDGKITSEDWGRVNEDNPWRWWINDDNDVQTDGRGENSQDIPRQFPDVRDCKDVAVDGIRDLIDFFPLHLDLGDLTDVFPDRSFRYRIRHEEQALKFYEMPDCVLDGSGAQFPNRHIKVVSSGKNLSARRLYLASLVGMELTQIMVTKASMGEGILVLEGAFKSREPLILQVQRRSDDRVMLQLEFPVHIVDVEDMYRHLNLRSFTGGADGIHTQTDEPPEYPDDLTNGRYVAYVHGYNVGAHSARGSQSNIFKRFHQLGSRARYVAVSWHGNPPNPGGSALLPPDYHAAVHNGLVTGMILKDEFAFTQGANLTILAHSLGNSVVGNAVANHGLEVDQYCIINGAMPLEAYDATQTSNSSGAPDMARNMTEDEWKKYYDYAGGSQRRLLAANWHTLFAGDPDDPRNELTWKDLFNKPALIDVAYNFYSPSDEVVENPDETEAFGHWENLWDAALEGARHAWVQQEMAKGGEHPVTAPGFHDLNGGWGFNFLEKWKFFWESDPEELDGTYYAWDIHLVESTLRYTRKLLPSEAALIPDALLKSQPFHQRFLYDGLYDPVLGKVVAGDVELRYKLLATGIPATSYAIAANSLSRLGDLANYNMPQELKSTDGFESWPEDEDSQDPSDWMHSDFKDVSFHFVYPMYQEIISLGGLDQE